MADKPSSLAKPFDSVCSFTKNHAQLMNTREGELIWSSAGIHGSVVQPISKYHATSLLIYQGGKHSPFSRPSSEKPILMNKPFLHVRYELPSIQSGKTVLSTELSYSV
ncbi:MAG: hypothetical protein ACD_75C01126G0003, partial [uncultured bacterium]